MKYSDELIAQLVNDLDQAVRQLTDSSVRAVFFSHSSLANADAKRFMLHGVSRRLNLVRRCTERIFEQFPPSQLKPLSRTVLEDVNISLHAFVIHTNALEDSLAWAYKAEFQLNFSKHHVSLFNQNFRNCLPSTTKSYLENPEVQEWHFKYSTDFRDSLVHQIPLYVPPAQLGPEDIVRANELQSIFDTGLQAGDFRSAIEAQDELNVLGVACPYFLHEFGNSSMILHPQILCDALTAVELFNVVVTNWAPPEVG